MSHNENENLQTHFATPKKYGDGDVCSKRRKCEEMQLSTTTTTTIATAAADCEHFQYESFESQARINSTLHNFELEENSDFKGGLLLNGSKNFVEPTASFQRKNKTVTPAADDDEQSRAKHEQNQQLQTKLQTSPLPSINKQICAKNDLIISKNPSPASRGFQNTFKLLQNHVSSSSSSTKKKLHGLAITDLAREEPPTRLELELEAQQRLQTLALENSTAEDAVATNAAACSTVNCGAYCQKPLMRFLQKFTGKNNCAEPRIAASTSSSAQNVDFDKIEADGLNLLYHATRNGDGLNHLRVIRNKSKVLCGNRVSQMTRAYDDIEAVTRLLEEKEKDLELTVQIGQDLLKQNNSLENRISELEADLKTANDDRAQLVHELHKKNELIAVLTNDADDGGSEAGETPTFSKSVTLDLLQKRVTSLQDENKTLKMEASQLAKQTDDVEEHERQLMEDITAQLNAANNQYDGLSLELERQREENRLQHEQIVSLTARLAEAEMRLHQLTQDNDEHLSLLNITKENQNSLALELVEFKQRYQEVLALLQETQEQLRKQRKRAMPQARSGSFMSSMGGNIAVGGGSMSVSGYGFLQADSLQAELMGSSMFSENSMDSGISSDRERENERIGRLMSQLGSAKDAGGSNSAPFGASALGGASLMSASGLAATAGAMPPPYHQRVFDTVRCASKNGNYADSSGTSSLSMSQMGAMSMSSASGPRMSASALPAGSYYRHDSIYDGGMGGRTLSSESLASQPDDNYPTAPAGVPGAPGAKDLEAALKRLTPTEVLVRRAMLSYAPAGTYNYDEQTQKLGQQQHSNARQKYQQTGADLPMGVRTPDSIMSTGSSGISSTHHMSASAMSSLHHHHTWRLPEKLQIVKPMEGSQTLHHWSRLATPTFGGLLEERPGVTIRGGRGLDDLGMQIYTLEDVEEDFNEDMPGKQFDTPGCTYTFTNSLVTHPDDGFVNDLSFLSQSQMSSRMASTSTSRQPSCPATPRAGLSRKNSCSTFSVNLGLASMLNERGIKAVTPSALNTPAGPNFSPTVTPCNSPEGSPTRSRSPEPLFGLLSSGADLIRRKLMGGNVERPTRNQQKQKQQQQQQRVMLSRLERRALGSLRLVEKCESIGLENIVAPQPSQGIVNRSSSPLSQLSSLKSLQASSNSIVDDLHFERDQIRSVLNKGLNKSKQTAAAAAAEKGTATATAASSSSSAYNSDNDDTNSFSGSDISLRDDDEHRTPTNKPLTSKTANAHKSKQTENAISQQSTTTTATIAANATTTPPALLPSQTEARIKQMQRQKSRRNLKNGMAAQRPDLGTINNATGGGGGGGGGGRVRNDLGRVDNKTATKPATDASSSSSNDATEMPQSYTQSFVGTVSSLLFGRKGGWL